MFRIFFSIISVFIIALFWSCNNITSEPTAVKTNSLLPLTVGNSWSYKRYDRSSRPPTQIDWLVTKTITIEGKEYFLITTNENGNNYFVARNEDTGLFFSSYDTTQGFTYPFFFKYPADDNEIYNYQPANTDSILTVKVTKQTITLNNQDYNCYSYTNENFNPYFPFMYFSENIGLIRHKLVYFSGNRGIDTTNYIIYDLQNKVLK